jgi:hypothetical protein
MEIECLGGGFCVHSRQLAGSLAYNFSYPKVMKDIIADHRHGRTELLDLKIGDTVWPTIIGEWDALDESRECKYNFKTRRDITSIKGLRQSHGNGEELQSIQQLYVTPFWVNHAMTHMLHRDDTIRALYSASNVIGAKTALRVLHGSIIRDKPNDASLESEVLFHKGAGSQGTRSLAIQRGLQGLTPDQNPHEYSPVASGSKKRKNRSEHIYPT